MNVLMQLNLYQIIIKSLMYLKLHKDIIDQLPRSGTPKQRALSEITYLVVHHAAAVCTPEATARYHVQSKGWPTIGYHFFIKEDGTTYQTARLNEITYHVAEYNPVSVGICLSGRYDTPNPPPPTAQQEALIQLVDSLLKQLNLGNAAVKGHYELRPTVCPGSEWFEEWRRWFFPQDVASAIDNLRKMIEELERENAEISNELAEMRDDFDMIGEIVGRWRSG